MYVLYGGTYVSSFCLSQPSLSYFLALFLPFPPLIFSY